MRTATVTLEFTLTADDSEARIREAFMRRLDSDGYRHSGLALTTTEDHKTVRVIERETLTPAPAADPNAATVALPAPDVADLTVSTDGRAVYFGAGSAALVVWLEQAFPAGTWIDDEDGRPWYRITGARFAPGMVGLAAEFFPPKADPGTGPIVEQLRHWAEQLDKEPGKLRHTPSAHHSPTVARIIAGMREVADDLERN